ncbi:wd and tetratricopeptide repeat-containing protein [Stemphylium lycopersici]|nr:wd and tetratricopeptide repeat-containing protein [Stemphylium lycopersici]
MGKNVILAGDLNVSRDLIDTARAEDNMRSEGMTHEEYLSTPNRRIFNQLLLNGNVPGQRDEGREEPVLYDLCREFHPDREGMFTHWEQKINARPGNFGSRIDFILCSIAMKDWFQEANIQEGLMGSDHCPVYAAMKDKVLLLSKSATGGIEQEAHILDLMNPAGMFKDGVRQRDYDAVKDVPPLSGKLLNEFTKRRNIRDMFNMKPAAAPKATPTSSPIITDPSPSAEAKVVHTSNKTEESMDRDLELALEASRADMYASTNGKPPSSQSPLKPAEKRRASGSGSPAKTVKRGKSSAPATASKNTKGQQSLKGFFQTRSKPPDPNPSIDAPAPSPSASPSTSTDPPSQSTIIDTAPAPPSPPPPSTESFDSDPRASQEASRETWTKLFSKKPAPRCEHGEPCVIFTTKKPVYDRLLKREVGQERKKHSDIRSIYGDRRWIDDLDIVNELEGHNGCVNALSWSTSGRLLASGSDDHRINIHSYHPESSTEQFHLTTSIMTGHRSNIFSVKFMPYSNDRTIVSATDDVRIFDIEHSGHSPFHYTPRTGNARNMGSARERVTLTEGDTNAKAFRCHTDTVKRIVTEDNPFYFLTCSNDGEVRQWDIRQPSRAYPPARDSMIPTWARDEEASDDIPPPLISYSRYGLDLNTVSCSPSQPHYIALGGAHLHCFLHDRRMLGRDVNRERGSRLSTPASWNENDDELLGKATQCVKKFAPNGKQRMSRRDGGHITACKISDAQPNELLVSWSQDHIYSFDMLRAPDAREKVKPMKASNDESGRRVRENSRKRKRPKSSTLSQEAAERAGSRPRAESTDDDLALRVTYGNGQSEDIRIQTPAENRMTQEELNDLRSSDHYRIASTTVQIAKRIFDLGEYGESGLHLAFTSILGLANSILSDMDDIDRTWSYPIDPDPVDVAVQNKLRDSRAASRRFVQAAGTLARVMGGQLLTGSSSDALIAQHFASIQPAPRERELPRHEQFGYDFLKAILLWLDSGPGAVVEGFSGRSSSARLPLPHGSDMDAIQERLIPYLIDHAGDDSIVNADASKFETDDTRILYSSETEAVHAFGHALTIPFADLTGTDASATGSNPSEEPTQTRTAAKRRWAYQVGRGLLLNASKDIKFAFVDRAYGGRGISDKKIRAEEKALRERQEDIDTQTDEGPVRDAELISVSAEDTNDHGEGPSSSAPESGPRPGAVGDADESGNEEEEEEDDDEEDDDDDDDDDDESDGDVDSDDGVDEDDDDSEEEDEEGLRRTRSGHMLWRTDFGRSRYKRWKVERKVPCAPHTRVYIGHCNVKTVKDVNYFGLQDEYVVSGSDSGHVFIWDRKTAQLLNILEGDGEVVNVVQGHPYEPLMAVSGIDHTVKIFSPDTHLQRNARKGVGVQSSDPASFSSLRWGRGRNRPTEDSAETWSGPAAEAPSDSDDEVAAGGLTSRRRMHQSYQITSQNDMDRKGGSEDYFISQAVFAQLARHIARGQGGGGTGGGEGGEDGDGSIVISEENCNVM